MKVKVSKAACVGVIPLILLRMTCAHASRRDNALSDLINSAHEIISIYHAPMSTDIMINSS